MINFYMFLYDIPQKAKVPNPSDTLRAFAMRDNLSCWIINDRGMDRAVELKGKLESVGGKVILRRYDKTEQEGIVKDAQEWMKKDAFDQRDSLAAKLKEAEEELDKARKAQSVDDVNECVDYAKRAIQQAKRNLNKALEAATLFDLIPQCETLYKGLKHAISAANQTWFVEQAQERAKEKAKDKAEKAGKGKKTA